MQHVDIARVCHAANRALQQALEEPDVSAPWEDLRSTVRDWIITDVEVALRGGSEPQLHETWMRNRRNEGWTLGERKDFREKTHPMLKTYSELSPVEQAKYSLRLQVIRALAEGFSDIKIPHQK